MAAKKQRRFWRIARRMFRWLRITVWLTILALLLLIIWFNRVGLPAYLKDYVVVALREHGMEVDFSRMRLVYYRGIVVENVQFGRSGDPRGLRASATEAELHLHMKALLHRKLDLEGVALRGGRIIIPVLATNEIPREMTIEKINGELRFGTNDLWDLSGLHAETFGVTMRLDGTVTNASAIRQWKLQSKTPDAKKLQAFWHNVISRLEQTKVEAPTEIKGTISGDAHDFGSFRVHVNVNSSAIDSAWGKGKGFSLSAQIIPQPGELIHADVTLQMRDAITRWGNAADVKLNAQITPSLTQWIPTNAHIELQVKRAVTPWLSASTLAIKTDFRPNPADPASSLADYFIRGQQVRTKWARFAQAEVTAAGTVSASNAWPTALRTSLKFAGGEVDAGRAASGTVEATFTLPEYEALRFADTNLSWWARLDQISAEVAAQLTDVHCTNVDLKTVSLKSSWQSPLLVVQELETSLYDGTLRGAAQLNASTRVLNAEVKSDFDPQKATAILTTNLGRWFAQFGWEKAPMVFGNMRVTLPVWTNQAGWSGVNWRDDILPTLSLVGNFQVGAGDYRSVRVVAAQSDFTYTNRTWHLPNLLVARPEGTAHIAHISDERTRAFQFVVDSTLDPRVVRPLLDLPVQRILDEFTLTSPPEIHAEISGKWHAIEDASGRASIAATNLGFHLQPVLECRTVVTFTNQVLTFLSPEVVRTEGRARAESIIIKIAEHRLYLNDATGRLDPAAVTKCIQPVVERVIAPYHFFEAPDARISGIVDLEDETRSDMRFHLEGGPFEWRAFRFQRITGDVHWAGTFVSISNVIGSLHGGSLEGSLFLDFTQKQGADFGFRARVRDFNLHSLVSDLHSPTNRLEGTLNGLIVVTNASTENSGSWFGYGNMSVQDGLLWDVPVLGLFSPILNAIKPGAGNSRAKEATATFTITNSVIATTDLGIHASGMQLNFDGTVDFDARVNGRMEAELFRYVPGLGTVVSKVLWPVAKLFEYKVTGTLNKPKSEPVFIPKILMMPFHPLRTMRELIEGGKGEDLSPK